MSISTSISRLNAYYRRNGVGATLRRAVLAGNRALFSGRTVLFYCDLEAKSSRPADLERVIAVERKRDETELNPQNLEEMTRFWNADLVHRSIRARFGQGASLWLMKCEGKLAGYGWTLQGRTVEPHFFRLGHDDVHLFDFYVFPQYRGQGLNPLLVSYILRELASECGGRAFIEAAEWNHAQLASLRKTSFHRLGRASKFTIFRRTIVCWYEGESMAQVQEGELKDTSIAASEQKRSKVTDARA
jgi:ribosomal protein S18 acetylase RimI-like enzyme